jgi:hypothetical protein
MTDKVAQGKRNKRKGSRNELKTKKLLESIGYDCCKAGGSLGIWDIIASHQTHTRYIQVKSNRPPPPVEREQMEDWKPPPYSSKELWVWKDGKRWPEVTIL